MVFIEFKVLLYELLYQNKSKPIFMNTNYLENCYFNNSIIDQVDKVTIANFDGINYWSNSKDFS